MSNREGFAIHSRPARLLYGQRALRFRVANAPRRPCSPLTQGLGTAVRAVAPPHADNRRIVTAGMSSSGAYRPPGSSPLFDPRFKEPCA